MPKALQALDVDVQFMILDFLSEGSLKSLLNVALSSRSLYRLSRSFIYRVIRFTFNRSRRGVNGRLIKQLLADDDLSATVREIRIIWAPSAKLQPGEGSKEDLELLGRALPKLTALKTFIWDAQYPILSWLLENLQKHHPQCLLYTRYPASQDPAQTLPRLCASPCLFSLDVTLTNGQHQAVKELQKVLTSALNLRDLTITSAFDSSHLLPYQETEPLLLRSLELWGCDIDISELPVAWPMLERLSLDRLYFLPRLVPDFAGLKSLRLRARGSSRNLFLGRFLRGCRKLEVLDLTGFTSSIQRAKEDFWENPGKTLNKLRLHEEESLDRLGEDLTLSTMHVGRIAKYCGNLRTLGLDIQCDGHQWPHAMLKHIADGFCSLVHLELNILIENPQHDHPTSPKATLDSVPEIWKYLWQEISNSRVRRSHLITTPRLRSLDLIAGSKRPAPGPSYEEWKVDQQRFAFDLSDRDDEARLGIANVYCTELEALRSKMSQVDPLWTHQQELIMNVATERARRGPHIQRPSVLDREMVRPSPFWDRLDKERFYYR